MRSDRRAVVARRVRVPDGARWAVLGENRFMYPDRLLARGARRWAVQTVRESAPWVDADDVGAIIHELAVNALFHSASGRGGGVDVRLFADRTGRLRVVVDDGQATTLPTIPPVPLTTGFAPSGRGLLLVSGLARDMGYTLSSRRERYCLVWAEL